MLTRRQIQGFSVKEGVPLYTIERDYIQTLFLYETYKHSNDFLFKGGTCLRMGYKLNRYSEDLDFNFNGKPNTGIKILENTATRLNDFGIESKLKKDRASSSGFGYKLRYKGPLYNGKEVSKGTIRIDISCRTEKVETTTRVINPVYDDCPSFVFICLTLDHILAEKIRALVVRGKPRDLYDIWFLSETTDFDYGLINEKLRLYDMEFKNVKINEILSNVEKDWKQDILPLVGFLPDIHKIKKTVGDKLKNLQK